MRERFLSFARAHGASADVAERWWRVVEARYSEPHRHYHTLQHIGQMLEVLGDAEPTLLAATWFHDAIYDGDRNEERSAALAVQALGELGFPSPAIARAEAMILATRSHDPSGLTLAEQRFLDADLSILGSDPARYRQYVDDIRKEYAHVPDEAFRVGRDRILRAFLQRPRIYFSNEFFDRFERQARENIEREMVTSPGA